MNNKDAFRLTRSEWAVAMFTVTYVGVFFLWFYVAGNKEFIWYVITLVGFISLVAATRKTAGFPPPLLWALSIWGLVHMLGGGVRLGSGVLYNWLVIPIVGTDDLSILKFDQVVHFYGFAVAAWMLWHLLHRHYPTLHGTWTIHVFPALASMGLGALNEIIEFIAVLTVPHTNVGGYMNTALDLVFNALGAVFAVVAIFLLTARNGIGEKSN